MPELGHVNPPQQARSRRTLERLVRAALDILEESGPDELTVQAVVARAESSIGSFYARFGGKDDLLEYLGERVWVEARDRWQAGLDERTWSGLPIDAVAEGAIRLLSDAQRSRATYLKALDRMGAGGRDGYASFRRYVLRGLADLLLERRSEIQHPDPEFAVRLGLAALSGAIETGDPYTGESFDREQLLREGQKLLMRYLTGQTADGDEQSEEDEGDVDFFDVWG